MFRLDKEQDHYLIRSRKYENYYLAVDKGNNNKIVVAELKDFRDISIKQKTWFIESLQFSLFSWENNLKDQKIRRISKCEWQDLKNQRQYSFIDFNRTNGLFLFDAIEKNIININDNEFSIGKEIGNLKPISTGRWIDFDQFNEDLVDSLLKETELCQKG